jgi:hypothetical protein
MNIGMDWEEGWKGMIEYWEEGNGKNRRGRDDR